MSPVTLALTEDLRAALAVVERLPDEDQNYIAALLRREIAIRKPSSLEDSQAESLSLLMAEARRELYEGRTKPMSKDHVIADD